MRLKRPLDILMTADAVGGVWQYATDLCAELTAMGHRATLALIGPGPDAAQRELASAIPRLHIVETGLPLDWLSSGAEPVEQAAREIAALARAEGASIVHCNTPALASADFFPAPVLVAAHGCIASWWHATKSGPLPALLQWHFQLTRCGLAAADAIVAPSASHAAAVWQTYNLPTPPLFVHNGRRALSVSRPATGQINAALTVGRLWDEAKNVALLDRVASAIGVPFLAAGALRGPNGEEIVPTHLQPLGQIGAGDLAALLAQRPIFVSAARFEPFGLAVLEAAAAGCPLILSDIPTFRELWDGAAVFVDPDDEAGFAAAIERLVQTPARRRELAAAAARRAEKYTPQATAAAMTDIYESLLVRREVAA